MSPSEAALALIQEHPLGLPTDQAEGAIRRLRQHYQGKVAGLAGTTATGIAYQTVCEDLRALEALLGQADESGSNGGGA